MSLGGYMGAPGRNGVLKVVFGVLDAVTRGGSRAGGWTFSKEGFCLTSESMVNI